MKKEKIRRLCLGALLAAAALVMGYIEQSVPTLPFLPPGAKAGFSNIAVIFACEFLSPFYVFTIVFAKSLFAFLTRGAAAGIMSASGGVLSALVTLILIKTAKNQIGIICVSILGALGHNAGQLIAAFVILSSGGIFYYAPALIIYALITGSVNGIISKTVIEHISRITRKENNENGL